MSHVKISTRVAELITFTKEKTLSNLSESVNRGDIKISRDDLSKISALVDLSISQGFTLGYQNVEAAIKEALIDNRKK
jgi:hypothetical protein